MASEVNMYSKHTTQTLGKSFLFWIFSKGRIVGIFVYCAFCYRKSNFRNFHMVWAACDNNIVSFIGWCICKFLSRSPGKEAALDASGMNP